MSIDNESVYGRCDACDLIAFEPTPCASCVTEGNKHLRYGPDCSHRCPECGESFCFDHWNEKAKTCNACEHGRKVASGEAREEWAWGRDA